MHLDLPMLQDDPQVAASVKVSQTAARLGSESDEPGMALYPQVARRGA